MELPMKILVEELPSRRIREIQSRMRRGGISQSGFLSASDKLIKVVRNDSEELERRGITHEQIADRLETLVGQAARTVQLAHRRRAREAQQGTHALWTRGVRMGRFEMARDSYMGYQECPFVNAAGVPCEDLGLGDCNFILWNHDAGLCLPFPGLAIHLIRDHHFFEGDVHYRVKPAVACAVLQLDPGVDYSPRWATESLWTIQWSTTESLEVWRMSDLYDDFLPVVDDPGAVMPVGDRGRLYLRGDQCVAVCEDDCRLEGDAEVMGAIWSVLYLPEGITGFRRVEHRYVELEGSS